MRKLTFTFVAAFALGACATESTVVEPAKSEREVCLASLSTPGNAQLAIKDCDAACADGADRTACGAMALAHLQSILEEVGNYVGLLKPAQSPAQFGAQYATLLADELEGGYGPQVDLRTFVNQFFGSVIRDLRGIRTGTYLSVGGGEDTLIPVDEVPLDPALLSIVYGKADSLALKGHWSQKELALLGTVANGTLSLIDFLMSQNFDVNTKLPNLNGAAEWLEYGIELLNAEPKLLAVDDPDRVAAARDGMHAMMSLLAGREESKEAVAQSTPGFLGLVEAEFAAPAYPSITVDQRFLKLRDVDADGTLSKGDGMLVLLAVNGEDVPLGFIYPLSSALTKEIFQFFGDLNKNLDGSGAPVRLAPLVNSAINELGVLAGGMQMAGVNVDFVPDAVAVDYAAFYDEFTGIRDLLPHWYHDSTTQGANKHYLDNITNATVKRFFAFEQEPGVDVEHFAWASTVTWESAAGAAKIVADGVEPSTGYYFLWQDPSFAGLLHFNTDPLKPYFKAKAVPAELQTGNQFVRSPGNLMTNAVLNAFLVWADD